MNKSPGLAISFLFVGMVFLASFYVFYTLVVFGQLARLQKCMDLPQYVAKQQGCYSQVE